MHSIAWWPSLGVLLLAAAIDVRARRVPNWLALPFLFSGLMVRGITEGSRGCGISLAGVGFAAVLFGIPYLLGGMGAGDLKLAAGIGAWIGPGQLFLAFIVTSIVGGICGLIYALRRGAAGECLDRAGNLIAGKKSDGKRGLAIPYVPALAVGTLFSFFAR